MSFQTKLQAAKRESKTNGNETTRLLPALFLEEEEEDDDEEPLEADEELPELEEEDVEVEPLDGRLPPEPEPSLFPESIQAHWVIASNPLPVGRSLPVIHLRAPFGVSGNTEVAFQVEEIAGQLE